MLKGLPWLWAASGRALAAAAAALEEAGPAWAGARFPRGAAGAWLTSEVAHTVAFVMALFVGSTLLELPWGVAEIFVVEERHGFNKQTLALFMSDVVKQVGGRRCLGSAA